MGDVTILLVEDEVRLATLISHGLGADGISVECAFDGDDGLIKAQAGTY